MTITLRPITRENWRECIRLKVAPEEERFVASNVGSLAQAAYETECVPQAVYADDQMVGFLMYARNPDDGEYWIYRLMVAQKEQGKGYGRAALLAGLELLRAKPDCRQVFISWDTDNERAGQLYQKLGFEKTGEIVDGEIIARLVWPIDG